MKEGDVFRIGKNVCRVEAQVWKKYEGCAGQGKMTLCLLLPVCISEQGKQVVYKILSVREVREAIKNKTEILTY
jgi:hypothetical protein